MIELVVAALIQVSVLTGPAPLPVTEPAPEPVTKTVEPTDPRKTPGGTGSWDDSN